MNIIWIVLIKIAFTYKITESVTSSFHKILCYFGSIALFKYVS